MPLRAHEDILVFYRKLPTYNPQFTKGKPYKANKPPTNTLNYGKRDGVSTGNDGEHYCPRDVIKFRQVTGFSPEKNFSPQQKPTALLEYLIKTYSNEGETVLDATMGSGSTGVACVNTDRKFIGFELDKNFFETAQKRIDEAVAKREQSLF